MLAGLAVGLVNGIGVAFIGVSPFIVTLGVQSIGFGLALYLTGGVPVSGLPAGFSELFGFGTLLGVPVPIWVTAVCVTAMGVLMGRMPTGTHLLAVGGNAKAAALSGIDTRRVLLVAYLLCAGLAAVSGLLLTARVETGEANLGGTVALARARSRVRTRGRREPAGVPRAHHARGRRPGLAPYGLSLIHI